MRTREETIKDRHAQTSDNQLMRLGGRLGIRIVHLPDVCIMLSMILPAVLYVPVFAHGVSVIEGKGQIKVGTGYKYGHCG